MNKELKLLALTSLPTVGNAGLKNMMSILADKMIPVPTLLACGLGNMDGHQKITIPFTETLKYSLNIAKELGYNLIVYTGYFKNKEQIDTAKNLLVEFKDIIKAIVVDPVCADNKKPYVDKSIIDNFHKLLEIADYAIPNETELRILTGNNFDTDIKTVINNFKKQFPDLKLVVTSVLNDEKYYNYIVEEEIQELPFDKINSNFSGTGDLFSALFIKHLFFNNEPIDIAVTKTANYISKLIAYNTFFNKKAYDLSLLTSLESRSSKGNLFYVIGPSGVGKDTLMNIAKKRLENTNVVFAQRYITRENSGNEDHVSISEENFLERLDQNFFCLWWQSHGNYYGISNNINLLLENSFNVVVNGSRGYYEEAIKKYPTIKTVLITAEESTIKERLLKRGRETLEQIEKRIERSKSFNDKFKNSNNVTKLSNNGELKVSSDAFVEIVSKNYREFSLNVKEEKKQSETQIKLTNEVRQI